VIQELSPGGAERVVLSLTHGARAAGHEVAIAAARGEWSSQAGGAAYPLPLIGRRRHRVAGAAWAAHRAIVAFRPDVVHAHNPAMAAVAGIATSRGRRTAAVVSFHGVPEADYRAAVRALRFGGLPVVACGPAVASALIEHGRPPVDTIVNGVAAPPPPADRLALAAEWDIPAEAPWLMTVGRLAPVKAQHVAVAALRELPEARLILVGDGPLRDELAAQAAAEGTAERVVFAGFRPDARALMAAADVIVMPSTSEGFPLAAVEALSSGTPLVATAARGLRELLHDRVDALVVPVGDVAAVAAAVRRLLADPADAARIAASAVTASAAYTEAAMVAGYLDLYAALAR
jgi:glycosyltransferase involved in cell wall biosynthesis